jgi:hypothetical protein
MQKYVKGHLERDINIFDNSTAPFSPIMFSLKIRKEKI